MYHVCFPFDCRADLSSLGKTNSMRSCWYGRNSFSAVLMCLDYMFIFVVKESSRNHSFELSRSRDKVNGTGRPSADVFRKAARVDATVKLSVIGTAAVSQADKLFDGTSVQ